MQFKYPELLYALLLLLIPIIIHLFQLRKFKKEAFTNVAFLKKVTLQTRKSSQIKKWLALLTRMALLAAIIIAFAQPFTSKNNSFKAKTETVIYLDNSFSMQAKGENGELLKRAVNDIISNAKEDETVSLITNNDTYKSTTVKAITNDLLSLNYSPNQLDYDAAFLKCKKYFSKQDNTIKNLVFISDFQEHGNSFLATSNQTDVKLNLVQLTPVTKNNVIIDSLYVSKQTTNNIEITAIVKNFGNTIENLPISLYDNGNLLTKSAVTIKNKATTTFTLPNNKRINGEIVINDTSLQFDNTLFFNINEPSKINVLAINNNSDDSFLKRIYTEDEFNYKSVKLNALNYSNISNQNLIVLNELNTIPAALTTALKAFTNNGGVLVIIPSKNIDIQSYNNVLLNYNFTVFNTLQKAEKRLTTIKYSHPLYSNGVFEKQVTNFQYPKVNSYYSQEVKNASEILNYEDGKPFLSENNNAFVFTSALNKNNTNFSNINLIVPTFYNIAKRSLQSPNLYYTINKQNTYDIATTLQKDAIVTLENNAIKIIPQQKYYNNKVAIITNETPNTAGIYDVKNKNEIIKNVSYNYTRKESNLVYKKLKSNDNTIVSNSVSQAFDTINNNKVNELWKLFVIFALLLLIIEMLILKYFK